MKRTRKSNMIKPFLKRGSLTFTKFSKPNMAVFGILFAIIGSYAIYSSFAAGPTATANLWVDTDGGTCTRQATPGPYVDAAACSSMQTAMR